MIATGNYFPGIVGILFIIGLIASAYSAAGSALTALTTSFTVDILHAQIKGEAALSKIRKQVHIGMAVVMGAVIFVFNLLNNTSVIDAIYTLASYTYGPILGLFAFGIFTKKQVYDKYIPLVAIASPILCYILQRNSEAWFNGYQISYELLLFNAAFTFHWTLLPHSKEIDDGQYDSSLILRLKMKKKINCFIPFGTPEDTMQTVKELQVSELVNKIYLLGSEPGKKALPGCEYLSVKGSLFHRHNENNCSQCQYGIYSVLLETNSIKTGTVCLGTHGANHRER